jgi:hypothetical protein
VWRPWSGAVTAACVAEGYVQHNPQANTGLAGFLERSFPRSDHEGGLLVRRNFPDDTAQVPWLASVLPPRRHRA